METIFTVGLDWIPAAARVLFLILMEAMSWFDTDWNLFMIEVGSIDLEGAYRYVPVASDQARFSIAAVWHIMLNRWMFLQLRGHADMRGALLKEKFVPAQ